MKPAIVDFETRGIENRPDYPPVPVGVAIKWPGRKGRYYAWGHPTENNATFEEGRRALLKAWDHPGGVVFHNAKFDLEVAVKHMDVPALPWSRVHDTMFLLFLHDPHSPSLDLKGSAERILKLPPTEQEEVRDWLLAHQPVPGVRISAAKKSKEPWGKYICEAPGLLVGRYAVGDVDRTSLLFDKVHNELDERMLVAYDRERRLLPHIMEMERQGLRVGTDQLRADLERYREVSERLDKWIKGRLGTEVINLNSGTELVAALDAAGKVDVQALPLTKKDRKRSTNRKALEGAVTDPQLLAALKYRGALSTCLSTFMEPWFRSAEKNDGLVYTTWYQTREPRGGTRTGRFSSSPNFQNIPKVFEAMFNDPQLARQWLAEAVGPEAKAKAMKAVKALKQLPPLLWRGMPALPWVRQYVVPYEDGHVLYDRDYSQQEYRILAHYDGGEILDAYMRNPRMDFHEQARIMVSSILGQEMDRKPIKNMGFGLLYGMGIGLLAEKLGVDVGTATRIKHAYLAAVPGIKELYKEARIRAETHQPIRTWGGRLYYCEPPAVVDGRLRKFDYKLPNVLIQGSAADATKEAMNRYMAEKPASHKLLITLHDELLVSAPRGENPMPMLEAAMYSIKFDVPMLSDGKMSAENWGRLKEVPEVADEAWRDMFIAKYEGR